MIFLLFIAMKRMPVSWNGITSMIVLLFIALHRKPVSEMDRFLITLNHSILVWNRTEEWVLSQIWTPIILVFFSFQVTVLKNKDCFFGLSNFGKGSCLCQN